MSWGQHSSINLPCQSGRDTSTPASTRIPEPAAGHPLVARYSAAALASGFTAIPNVVFDHSATLGVSAGELAFAERVTRYQRDDRAPFPAERTIAAQMGKSTRQIRNYIAGLRRKGFVRVLPRFCPGSGRQTSNAYDFTPLIEAAVTAALAAPHPLAAASDGGLGPRAAAHGPFPCVAADFHLTRKDTSALEEEVQEKTNTIRCPLPPDAQSEEQSGGPGGVLTALSSLPLPSALAARSHDGGSADTERPDSSISEADALQAPLAALGCVFGDRCPAASVTRAGNLLRAAGLSVPAFLRALDEAARRTLAASRRRHAPRPRQGKLMAYMFAVLENLLSQPEEPAPLHRSRRSGARREPAAPPRLGSVAVEAEEDLQRAEDHPIWQAVLRELRETMTVSNVERCARAHVVSQDGTLLCLAVPDTAHLHWLERVQHRIERALVGTGHAGMRVAFQLAE